MKGGGAAERDEQPADRVSGVPDRDQRADGPERHRQPSVTDRLDQTRLALRRTVDGGQTQGRDGTHDTSCPKEPRQAQPSWCVLAIHAALHRLSHRQRPDQAHLWSHHCTRARRFGRPDNRSVAV